MLFLKSSQFKPSFVTALSSFSMLSSLFWMRIVSSCLTTSPSTLMPISLPRCASSDWSIKSRRANFWRSSTATCSCSGVHRPLHSCWASSAAAVRAFSSSELVIISLLTRAMISSTTLPSPVKAGFPGFADLAAGVAGFLGCSGSGAAICGASREGGFCAAGVSGGGGLAGGFCARSGRANINPASKTVFFIIFPIQ